MSVKLFTRETSVYERRKLAAKLDMFEVFIDDELVLIPVSQANIALGKRHEFYKLIVTIEDLKNER